MKKGIVLILGLMTLGMHSNAQSKFMQRLSVYYDINIINKDSLCNEIWIDTIINNYGNYEEFINFTDSCKTLYRDTLININILYMFQSDPYRKAKGLSNSNKIKILTFISDIILSDYSEKKHKAIFECLFNPVFWEFERPNDGILYDKHLMSNLQQIIKNYSENLQFSTVRLFAVCGLDNLFPLVIRYAIKPYFKGENHITNKIVWTHIYFLAKYNNKEVLPYLLKAVAESGCKIDFYFHKYGNIHELLWIIGDTQIKKNILLNLIKDDCLTELIVPTIDRDDIVITYFEANVLNYLKEFHKEFPIEEVRKLNEKKQLEFVKNWINKNM